MSIRKKDLKIFSTIRSKVFLTVWMNFPWTFSTICGLFKVRNGHETFGNRQGRWKLVITKRLQYHVYVQASKTKKLLHLIELFYEIFWQNWKCVLSFKKNFQRPFSRYWILKEIWEVYFSNRLWFRSFLSP